MSVQNLISNLDLDLNSNSISNLIENRSFKYGDGLFETMVYRNGEIQFFADHFERLTQGLKLLKMKCNFEDQKQEIESKILTKINELNYSQARIKWTVWRKNGGLYTPTNSEIDYIIEINPLENYYSADKLTKLKSGYAESIFVNFSPISHLKTNNALPYILASIERKERELDEIILLNQQNEIAECSSSNIFMVKNETIFTPSLKSGCVAGVMRKKIIEKTIQSEFYCKESTLTAKMLMDADYIFTTNVVGIKFITQIDDFVIENFVKNITNSRYFASILSSF